VQLTTTLDRRTPLSLILAFVGIDVRTFARRLGMALGHQRPQDLSLDDIKIPDTADALAATDLVQRCSETFLFNHCIRTYLFGMAVARNVGLGPDEEVFYLSSIMHDLGLVKEYDKEGSFELNGAVAAREFVVGRGLDTSKADMIHEAIALHTSVGIAHKREPEIALVHFGAGVDVIGYRDEDLTAVTRERILERAPRLKFKENFCPLMADQAERKPGCSIAGHVGLGFIKKMQQAPFAQ
jgi:hypothetical protein